MTITPDRLSGYEALSLDHGGHESFEDGHCAMEVVAWLAGEGHTDAPTCASPILRHYTIALNDRWDDTRRQTLKPYLPRMVGTGNDGKDQLREEIAARFLVDRLLADWLALAGLDHLTESLRDKTGSELRAALRNINEKAWELRKQKRAELETTIREHLKPKPAAVAAAVAAAAAAADAVADAVADAAADAVAVAVADAVAVAVAAAVAVAVADAAAAAAADADAASPNDRYMAAYCAARDYYRANPLPIMTQVQDLAAKQAPLALELLDALIDPQPAD